MAGMFEIFADSDSSFRFQLTAPDGTVMALSKPFPDKRAAVAGIAEVREYAGMGFVTEIPAPATEIISENTTAPGGEAADRRKAIPAGSFNPARLPRARVSSAARALGGRAASRKQQILVRWGQSLGSGGGVAEFRTC
ncbi:DUF1508 domain-containing protein [Arthrobacter oryzae]|uniref:YegP family protein n=1 Tax=Arthrobacter oryzae TaxID=409290 RepID=UPI00285BEA17|nr:DUF1508 domain-containing protein [Arthrobacter oryzae]MDR6504689.1 uncharacterized protein YegP (UPF0339 family) [Arthrobacter oryzae]